MATNNHGKQKEIRELLSDLGLELITPSQMGLVLDVEETGATYAENATLKATAFARATGLLSLADDSGLEVDVLEGAPGLHSARYAPAPGAGDAGRRAYLLQQLSEKPKPWLACFRCTVAVADPQGALWLSEGSCQGHIIPEERGQNGFGYDPIFLLPDLGLTMAELTMEQKNQLSHRAQAIRATRHLLFSRRDFFASSLF